MVILNVRYTPYRIPFRQSFTTAHGTLTTRTGAIVEVCTTDGISGIGEIAPLPGFSRETPGEALAPLAALTAQLQGEQLAHALHILSQAASSLPASLVYGLETALLDALSKQRGYQFAGLLSELSVQQMPPNFVGRRFIEPEGGEGNAWGTSQLSRTPIIGPSTRPRLDKSSPYEVGKARQIAVNAVIGAHTIEETVKSAQVAVAAGFTCLKLKVGANSQQEIERITAVRAAVGPTIQLRLDANAGWNYEQALTTLLHCVPLAIEYVEQPLPAHDLDGMRRLRRAVSVPIAADEALTNLASARRILAREAADIFIIKPQAAGGLFMAQQMIQEAARQGIQSVVTSMLETGIGVTAALHLAMANGLTRACGLATLPLLIDDLLLDDLSIHNGTLELPASPGLGVELDRAGLQNYKLSEVSSEYH